MKEHTPPLSKIQCQPNFDTLEEVNYRLSSNETRLKGSQFPCGFLANIGVVCIHECMAMHTKNV
jgi:hypothetical protein